MRSDATSLTRGVLLPLRKSLLMTHLLGSENEHAPIQFRFRSSLDVRTCPVGIRPHDSRHLRTASVGDALDGDGSK